MLSHNIKCLFLFSLGFFFWVTVTVSQISLSSTLQINCTLDVSRASCYFATSANTAACNAAALNESVTASTSCVRDCICTHNGTFGQCDSAGGSSTNLCRCSKDPNMDATTLTELRNQVCTPSIYYSIGPELCSDLGILFDFCNQDCKCGHGTKGGQCNGNGTFTANGLSWGRCACEF